MDYKEKLTCMIAASAATATATIYLGTTDCWEYEEKSPVSKLTK
jgi:hypothetical protein